MAEKQMAVLTLSGGMDSAVTAAIAIAEGYKPAAVHLNYGQRTEKRELSAFNDLCMYFGISRKLIIDAGFLSQIGGSSLTDASLPIEQADLQRNEIPATYVPFRNAIILSMAVAWAEKLGADAVFAGANQLDTSGYPDCREDFFLAFQEVVRKGTATKKEIKILAPLLNLTKKDIVLEGKKLNVPFELTWSCYQNSDFACGVCDSCVLRLRGFALAGFKDPLIYL